MCKRKKQVSSATIGRHAQDRIGRELRAMYAEMLTQPLPGELIALLDAFEDAETAQARLRTAVRALRQANVGLHLNITAKPTAPPSLSVRAQHALLARAMVRRPAATPAPRSRRRPVRAAS